jgi:hypothetical protein
MMERVEETLGKKGEIYLLGMPCKSVDVLRKVANYCTLISMTSSEPKITTYHRSSPL